MATTPDINFLKKDKSLYLIRSKRKYIIHSLSLSILAVYGFVLFSILSYLGFLTFQLTTTDKKIKQEINAIEELAPIESKYVAIKTKVKAVLGESSSNFRHQDLIQAVFQLIPSELSVQGFEVNKNKEIVFSGSTTNPQAISQFIANINKQIYNQTGTRVTNATIESISVNSEGTYSFGVKLSIEFPEEKS